MNIVASQTRLMSHKPQQKCIHCNSVPTDKFLTFDKTKYGENTIVSQMKENDEQISYVTSVTMQFSESLLLHGWCEKTMKKMFTLKFDMEKYSWLQNKILEMPKSKRNNS